VIFVALGLILIILGYAQRPKPIISIPEVYKPAVPPSRPEREKPKTAKKRRKTRKKA
jgi:hypothetical protein